MKEASLIRYTVIFVFLVKIAVRILPTLTTASVDWLLPICISILFILIGLCIFIAGNSLLDYKIDSASLVVFLLFATVLRTDTAAATTVGLLAKVIVWAICCAIVWEILVGHVTLTRPGWSQVIFFIGAVVGGLVLSLVEGYMIVHKPGFQPQPVNSAVYSSVAYIARSLADQASNAAVPEEYVFRGLLWGYLVKRSYSNKKAYLIQALLFWLSHFDRAFVSPMWFWVISPMFILFITLLAWRSRSLLASMTTHAVFNTFQVVFAVLMMAQM